ncbi:hypothetical protein M0802_012281, partial [Mischocyttarus mexicanus]
YGISGQSNVQSETKVFNKSAEIGKESQPTNTSLNPNNKNTVTQLLAEAAAAAAAAPKQQPSLISNTNATNPQINNVPSNAGTTEKEVSVSPNTLIIDNTSATNKLVVDDQTTPKNVENDSKTLIDDSNVDKKTPTTTKSPVTTSKPVPTTTAAPPTPLPNPKPAKWMFNGTNETCIIVNMAVQFNVSQHSDKNNQTTYKVFNLPDKTNETKVSGSCGKLEQSIALQWNGTVNVTNTFTLHFTKNETTKQYYFHHLELNITEGNQTSMFVHNTTLFSTGLSNSYRCLKQQNVTFDSNKTTGYLMMSDLQFQAFKADKEVNFGEAKDCKLDTPDIVPIAVGCALAGLVVIVLIAYLIGRKRSQSRGYLSM